MIHAAHVLAIDIMKRAMKGIAGQFKVIVIVYDGPGAPTIDRKASYYSDAPPDDVAKVCQAVAAQAR